MGSLRPHILVEQSADAVDNGLPGVIGHMPPPGTAGTAALPIFLVPKMKSAPAVHRPTPLVPDQAVAVPPPREGDSSPSGLSGMAQGQTQVVKGILPLDPKDEVPYAKF